MLGVSQWKKELWPVNQWIVQENSRLSEYITDDTTKKEYLYTSTLNLRITFAKILTFGMGVHSIALVSGVIYRVFRFLSFNAFWSQSDPERDLKSRTIDWVSDGVHILLSPLAIPAFFLTALYGLFMPYDGMKLHSKMEIIFYGHALLWLRMHARPLQDTQEKKLKLFQVNFVNIVLLDPLKITLAFLVYLTLFLSFYSFWAENGCTLKERQITWLKNGLKVLVLPFALLLLLGVNFYIPLINAEHGCELYKKIQCYCYGETLRNVNILTH